MSSSPDGCHMFHPSIAGEILGLLPLAGAVEPQAAASISQTQHKPCGAFRAGREVCAVVQRIFLRKSGGDHWGNPPTTWKKPHQKSNVVKLNSPPDISKNSTTPTKTAERVSVSFQECFRSVSHQESSFTQQRVTGIRDSYQPQHTFVSRTFESDILFLYRSIITQLQKSMCDQQIGS